MKRIYKLLLSLLALSAVLFVSACFSENNNIESPLTSENLESSSLEDSTGSDSSDKNEDSTESGGSSENDNSTGSDDSGKNEDSTESDDSTEKEDSSLGTGSLTGNGVELPDVPLG